MRRRFRTFAALLALMAFSGSYAEQVRAGTCAPPPAAAAEHHLAAAHADAGHGRVEMPSHPAPHPGPGDPDECPVQAVAGGCSLLPLPLVDEAAPAAAPPRTTASRHTDSSLDLLLVSSFFRPPQR